MHYSFSRRNILKLGSAAALSGFVNNFQVFAANNKIQSKTHFKAKAKRVIYLNMTGAPSHVDTFDYKPKLFANNGKVGRYGNDLLAPVKPFKQSGKSGLWMSNLFPNLQKVADEICLLNGMYTDQPNHLPSQDLMHTGSFQFSRPSLGSWILFGLGNENKNIPGFITLNPVSGTSPQYGSSFLPAEFQGAAIGKYRPISGQTITATLPNIQNKLVSSELQRKQIDFTRLLNQEKLRKEKHGPEINGVQDSLELAYNMQSSMPKILDYEVEKEKIKEQYGLNNSVTADFGSKLLLARRFVEAGARFVEVTHGNWDHHFNISKDLSARCSEVDLPISTLIQDLKARGLFEETLIVWAGEFGRTPEGEGDNGRNHNNKGFTTWLAGGGVKGGMAYGSTDELGYEAMEGRMSIHDWHATILHLLGFDHEKLTYSYAGRDFRLTDVFGEVAKEIIA